MSQEQGHDADDASPDLSLDRLHSHMPTDVYDRLIDTIREEVDDRSSSRSSVSWINKVSVSLMGVAAAGVIGAVVISSVNEPTSIDRYAISDSVDLTILSSGTNYHSDTVRTQIASLQNSPTIPTFEPTRSSMDMASCLAGLQISPEDIQFADVAYFDNQAALILTTKQQGNDTIYVVHQTCNASDPSIIYQV